MEKQCIALGAVAQLLFLCLESHKEIAQLVAWKSVDMATYYSQHEKVMSNGDASSVLSCAAKQASMSSSSIAELKGNDFRDRNHLKGYEPLFHWLNSFWIFTTDC